MIINHNMQALNAHRQMGVNAANSQKSMEKLSSGLRVNRAGDDAAGLSISEKMRGQIRGLDQAGRNAQDGISMIQTAEGALNETHSILQRMRELSVQSANGTNTDADRAALQEELNELTSEINRIGNTTEFNTQKLLNGSAGGSVDGKLTDATSAKLAGGTAWVAADTTGQTASIKVDGTTFDLSEVLNKDWTGKTSADFVKELENVTAGGVKLSDVVDIKVGTGLEFTAKSTGGTSKIEVKVGTGNDDAAKMLGFADAATANGDDGKVAGTSATIERHGLEGTTALDTDITITKGSSFTVQVGTESAVTVNFNKDKTYDLDNTDTNIANAARQEFIKDINAALQEAGISDKVTAALSNDNKLQFISETGKDIAVKGLATAAAGTGIADTATVKNVSQVVGSGAEGSGFNTKFQIGANTGQSISLQISDMRSAALGLTGNSGQTGFTKENGVTNGSNNIKGEAGLNISNREDASKSITVVDKALEKVSSERSKLGAIQNRLEHTINNLGTASENLTAAESRIRDVDMAKEMMTMSKNNILNQAAQAMLAQANQAPQQVLQLLR